MAFASRGSCPGYRAWWVPPPSRSWWVRTRPVAVPSRVSRAFGVSVNAATEAVRLLRWLAARLERGGDPRAAELSWRHADALEKFELMRAELAEPEVVRCKFAGCDAVVPQPVGPKRGHPRWYCDAHSKWQRRQRRSA